LCGANAAFVVVAVFDAPAFAENAGMASGVLHFSIQSRCTVTAKRVAGSPGRDRRDDLHGGFAGVDAAVIFFAAQVKKGVFSRARHRIQFSGKPPGIADKRPASKD
jgi:hypothetical protein